MTEDSTVYLTQDIIHLQEAAHMSMGDIIYCRVKFTQSVHSVQVIFKGR